MSPLENSTAHIHLQENNEEETGSGQLVSLAGFLLGRRETILTRWRAAGGASSGCSLSRTQFNDHIPGLLDCFANALRTWPADHPAEVEEDAVIAVCEHGLQRWQQGYQLRELIREWGTLQMCVVEELEEYGEQHPEVQPRVMRAARAAWARLCSAGVTQSATQYWHLHKAESEGHVNALENALATLKALEISRAEGWRRAAHDLRGSITVVKGASILLSDASAPHADQVEVTDMLSKSVSSLNEMLNDLLGLARLEAGHEQLDVTSFDAAKLIGDFCTASQPSAGALGLFLESAGPEVLPVQGDRSKILRILQNLLLNALKYTSKGGVSVSWDVDSGRDTDRWTFSVSDTGPGIDPGTDAPLAQHLHGATLVGDDGRAKSTDRRRDMAPAGTLESRSETLPPNRQPGEGIGLSIVKRLCELLDASLELASSPGKGSTFRVMLPRSYAADRGLEV